MAQPLSTATIATPTRKRKPRISRRQREEWLTAYAFLSLQLIGLVVFTGIPLVLSFYFTFTHWNLVDPAPTWVGLENWQYFFQDERILRVYWNTIRFILMGTTSFLVLSLLLALLLNKPRAGIGIYRVVFLLPWVLSQVAVGLVWSWMFNTRSGPVALGLKAIGMDAPNMLLDARYAMLAIAIVTTWQAVGYGTILFMAGLKGIPNYLYDAALVDGANPWQRFRFVTLPLLSPTVLFLTITSFIGAFQLYDAVVIMTGAFSNTPPGGPKDSTRTVVLYLYNQMFQYSERISGLGYAATIAWTLAIVLFAITLLQWWLSKRWVFYLGDGE
jgi:multiple sugar transport system permease protein